MIREDNPMHHPNREPGPWRSELPSSCAGMNPCQ